MGISLQGKIRMQINLKMERSSILSHVPLINGLSLSISTFGKMLTYKDVFSGQNILVPLMWFEELIDPPPESVLDMLAEALSTGSIVANKALIFSMIFLTLQLIIFGSYTLWKRKSGTFLPSLAFILIGKNKNLLTHIIFPFELVFFEVDLILIFIMNFREKATKFTL